MSDMTPCGEPPLDQPDYYLEPYYEDDAIMLLLGDAAEVSSALDPQSIQAVVTSPPYFGLRDYGVDGQLGAEASPAEFVANLVAVFEAIRPALADDGVMWVVLGDSYSNTTAGWGAGGGSTLVGSKQSRHETPRPRIVDRPAKNLLGIPWRFAFAMQDAGWILRNDIIWAKPNGMPESVTDRLSTKHEHVFMFAKSPRYYFNLDPIRRPLAESSVARLAQDVESQVGTTRANGGAKTNGNFKAVGDVLAGANPGDWWAIPTQPFPGAHFATFPPELPRRCVLASTREGGKRCDCDEQIMSPTGTRAGDDPSQLTGRAGLNRPRGASEGTRPITHREQRSHAEQIKKSPHIEAMRKRCGTAFAHYIRTDASGARPLPQNILDEFMDAGWLTKPAPCEHPEMPADTVLDPFSGSGTTGMVANQAGRKYVGIDLNPEYHDLALKTRLAQGVLS